MRPKDGIRALLEKLPDDASYEDIQYHVHVLEKINRGLERGSPGGAIPHEDAKARLSRWLAARIRGA